MTARLRKAIYALFLLGFFVTAPAVVLYTAGFRLNLGTLHVVKTGLLSVHTAASGADVLVDGLRQNGKTPVLIDNLLPGEHLVRVEKAGFIPWEKRLVIVSQRTTFVSDLVLFADASPTNEVSAPVSAFDTSTDGRAVYALSQAGWMEIWTEDGDGGNRRLLSRIPNATTVALHLSEDGSFVSVSTKGAKSSDLSLVNTTSGAQVRVNDLVPGTTDGWWDAGRGDRFFARAGGKAPGLYAITLPSASVTKLAVPPESQPSSAMSDGDAFLVLIPTSDGIVLTRWNGTAATGLASVGGSGPLAFAPSPASVHELTGTNGRLVLVDAQAGTPLLDTTATASRWHGDELLYTDGFGLHVFDVGSGLDETLTRVSDPILSVAWHPVGSAVVFAQAGAVTAIELDDRDHHVTTTLASGSGIRGAWIDQKASTLHVIGTIGGTSGIFARPL
jgi:hypothetical protein